MSKMYNKYLELKAIDKNKVYIFEVGIFYIFLDEDARLVCTKLTLKLTKLTGEIVKCGFPVANYMKYQKLLDLFDVKHEIVRLQHDSKVPPSKRILDEIKTMNIVYISPLEALSILNDMHEELNRVC